MIESAFQVGGTTLLVGQLKLTIFSIQMFQMLVFIS